jgi:hypothetical protein
MWIHSFSRPFPPAAMTETSSASRPQGRSIRSRFLSVGESAKRSSLRWKEFGVVIAWSKMRHSRGGAKARPISNTACGLWTLHKRSHNPFFDFLRLAVTEPESSREANRWWSCRASLILSSVWVRTPTPLEHTPVTSNCKLIVDPNMAQSLIVYSETWQLIGS